jgi:glycerophosphoryl diester phosphodiesterase
MAPPCTGLARSLLIVTLTLITVSGGARVVNVAHRGGISADHPENSLAAFRHAIAVGADVIELDLRATRDGEIVILHDETLDRTTSGTGKVTGHTLAEVRKLGIPTYREALQLCAGSGTGLLLDIKVSPQLDKAKVVQLTREYDIDVILGVRTVDDLREFRRLAPNLRTLAFVPSVEAIEEFVAAGAGIVRLWLHWINADRSLVNRVRAMGKPVWVTANNAPAAEMQKLIRLGVDGILTDYPETLARLIAQ